MAPPQTALIVDDNEPLADTLAQALRSIGIAGRTAHSGIEGYASFLRDPTDWIVTDIEMPELTGIEMMRCIRLIQPAVKTIYMTGAVDKYGAVLSREAREFAAKVLYKPFTLNLLVEQIRSKRELPYKTAMKLGPTRVAPGTF